MADELTGQAQAADVNQAVATPIETVSVTLAVPKESKEVADVIVAIAKLVLKKAEFSEYATLIGDASKAVAGYEKIKDEVKSEHKGDLAGYVTKEVVSLF